MDGWGGGWELGEHDSLSYTPSPAYHPHVAVDSGPRDFTTRRGKEGNSHSVQRLEANAHPEGIAHRSLIQPSPSLVSLHHGTTNNHTNTKSLTWRCRLLLDDTNVLYSFDREFSDDHARNDTRLGSMVRRDVVDAPVTYEYAALCTLSSSCPSVDIRTVLCTVPGTRRL